MFGGSGCLLSKNSTREKNLNGLGLNWPGGDFHSRLWKVDFGNSGKKIYFVGQDTPKGKWTWNLRYTIVEKEKHLQTTTFGVPCWFSGVHQELNKPDVLKPHILDLHFLLWCPQKQLGATQKFRDFVALQETHLPSPGLTNPHLPSPGLSIRWTSAGEVTPKRGRKLANGEKKNELTGPATTLNFECRNTSLLSNHNSNPKSLHGLWVYIRILSSTAAMH